jgi:hypothetical protein
MAKIISFFFGGLKQTLLIGALGFDDLSPHTVQYKTITIRTGIKISRPISGDDTLYGFFVEMVIFSKVGDQHVHALFELFQYGFFSKSLKSTPSSNNL